ncbi:MAG TPA: HAD-IA family hydrolase [Ktedonobacterales bacterium]|jgi:putative hydrolase of the HAD superfamily|nr:HAD-IA family hydrolase [Ktedonobacterales bacterium]
MRPDVIIFDLYGTLVNGFSYSAHERALVAMTQALRTPDPEAFTRSFTHETWLARGSGQFASIEENIAWIYARYGWPLAPDRLDEAIRIRVECTRAGLAPLPGALEALTTLRQRGHRLGLISDCSAEIPALWETLPFAPLIEEPVFSCAVGYLKPNPRIYQIACERLGVASDDCLYVGDRPEEVIGARAAGIRAIRVRPPHDDTYEAREVDRPVWDGPELDSVALIPAALADNRSL